MSSCSAHFKYIPKVVDRSLISIGILHLRSSFLMSKYYALATDAQNSLVIVDVYLPPSSYSTSIWWNDLPVTIVSDASRTFSSVIIS